jgi:phage terminase large subunit-like protein
MPLVPAPWHGQRLAITGAERDIGILGGFPRPPCRGVLILSAYAYQEGLSLVPPISSGEGKWMAPEKWDLGADRTISLEVVIKEAISIKVGIDKGGQDDLSAIAVLGRCNRGEGDHFLLWVHQWISRDGYEKRKNTIPYDDFVAEGGLTVVDRVTDDVPEMADVAALAYASGKLSLVGIDSYCSPSVVKGLVEAGIPEDIVQSVKQGGHLQPAIFFVEEVLATGRLQHNGPAVMRWNIFNAVLTRRGAAVSISKSSVVGSDKIDGVAALLNAAAAHLRKAE